ncbi:hypothetical protein Rhe02_65010 [Rhizocola hellebori]|uniref:Uncharacterized protein n=1 Tax=Rhizocola hellebori TaxID=1392758 RepID=A0A8J3QEW1_9ACTN|nr:hypothetical protein Rhe02_65010 [Rhizocola hellebori]
MPDKYGFAVWNGVAAVKRTPATTTIVEVPAGSGQYRVTFPGQAHANGYAHVTAINGGGRWCQLNNWFSIGADARVDVDCYNPGGFKQSTNFSVMYAGSSGPGPVTGAHVYYAYNLGGVPHKFNSTGAVDPAPIDEPGVGSWLQNFNGIGGPMMKGQLQVTALNFAEGARCKASAWFIDAGFQQVRVKCYNSAGAPLDTRWVLSYHERREVVGKAGPKFAYGTLWWPGTPPLLSGFDVAETNYSSVGMRNTVLYVSTGRYLVSLPNVAGGTDHVQVTGYGHLNNRWCQLEDLWFYAGNGVQVKVACFNNGQPADSGFFVTYSTV